MTEENGNKYAHLYTTIVRFGHIYQLVQVQGDLDNYTLSFDSKSNKTGNYKIFFYTSDAQAITYDTQDVKGNDNKQWDNHTKDYVAKGAAYIIVEFARDMDVDNVSLVAH